MPVILVLFFLFSLVYSERAPDGGKREGSEPQSITDAASAQSTAFQFLVRQANKGIMDKTGEPYYFTQPSLFKYGAGQWLWDSCAAVIANSRRNIDDAILEFRTLLASQQIDGRIPEEISWPSGNVNAVTQMPTVAFTLQALFEQSGDQANEILKEFLPAVVAYHEWWRDTRRSSVTGLVATIHPWETGIDASPAFDDAWGFTPLGNQVEDWLVLYPKFPELQTFYENNYDYNATAILARESAKPSLLADWFVVEDIAMNVLYGTGWHILGDLALELGDAESAALYHSEGQIAESAILDHMWNETLSRFVTTYRARDGTWGHQSRAHTIQSLFPLLMRNLSSTQRDALVRDATDPNKFWTNYPFPSVSVSDASYLSIYEVNLLWRGPSWGFTNWFVLLGLQYQSPAYVADTGMDLQKIVVEACERWLEALKVGGGIWEMWNAETGIGYGAEGLGMSTVFVDWFYRTGLL